MFFLIIFRPVLLRMRNVPDKFVQKKNQNIFYVQKLFFFFFLENHTAYENVEKYCRARQAADDNMAHAHCMLDTEGYT